MALTNQLVACLAGREALRAALAALAPLEAGSWYQHHIKAAKCALNDALDILDPKLRLTIGALQDATLYHAATKPRLVSHQC